MERVSARIVDVVENKGNVKEWDLFIQLRKGAGNPSV